jgi:hypothetical protein
MAELDDAFSRLLGRQATDAERQRLLRVQGALGLRNNDALWLVLIALEHYQELYEQVPAEIRKASEAAVAEVTATANAAAKKASEQARAELARALTKAAAGAARGATVRQLLQWSLLTVLVVTLLVGGVGWWSYRVGSRAPRLSPVAVAAPVGPAVGGGDRVRGRTAWAESAEGRLAFELAKLGSLGVLARCEGPGWEIRKDKCYPQPLAGQTVYGWAIPPVGTGKNSGNPQ